MVIRLVELGVHWIGGLLAVTIFGTILVGIWRGVYRPAGKMTGISSTWLRMPVFYLIATTVFIGISVVLWQPLPVGLSEQARLGALVVGTIAYFPGMAFVLWGRLALGKMYFVSTSFAAPLFNHPQLVMHGPFAVVRHPMYIGLILSAFGSLLIYQTWTTVVFALCAPFLLLRARREELALAAEFGEQWQVYCQRVPALIPGRIDLSHIIKSSTPKADVPHKPSSNG
jgi:isoprenylcysteine carboxyl methyltransferase (ICMT) family protein YpbQ